MDDRDDPTPPPAGETLADLVARCIVAAENGGDAAMAELLAAQPELAAAAGAQLQILAHSGLLAPRVEPPTAFGPYRVLRRLGSGGMGEVFLAEQQQPLCRQVAVKVIRAGMDTRSVLARFAVERQALALLDHPNIAKVLDAGVTADGRPYLVMDYIAGESITRYCDLRQLSAEARIALFAHVCDVVQHAHHKGIMHRDLKPSNVLVGDRDGRPWPVVIDFGVAKSVGGTLPDGSLETRAGQLIGTPEYMSPEQASGAVDVDTRTDVFSLGVLLYELLTGVLPIAAGRLRGVPAGDIPRILRETEAPTPSTRITGLGDQAAAVARCRSTDIATLRRRLRGDLDWIALKALARDRNQRYGMPGELAADLRRHLLHEPVTAGPPRTWYRWQKFLRRNRLQVGAAAAVFVAMAGGLLASLLFYQDAAASAVASDRSLDDALAAVGELVQVGDGDLADVPHLEDVRRRLLERAVSFYRRFLDRAPADDPRLVPRIIESTARLGAMEARLGHYRQAEPLLREAVARSEPWLGNGVSVLAQAENLLLLAGVAEALADRPAIEPLQRRAQLLLRAEQARAPDDADAQLLLLRALKQHGATAAKTDPQQALSHLDQAMALVPPLLAAAAHRPRSIVPVLELGILRARVLLDLGRRDDALAAANAMRELRAEALPEAAGAAPDWQAAVTGEELAKLYGRCEQIEPALAVLQDVEAAYRRLLQNHPAVLRYRMGLANILNDRAAVLLWARRHDDGLRAARESVQQWQLTVAQAPAVPATLFGLAVANYDRALLHVERREFDDRCDWGEVAVAIDAALGALAMLPAAATASIEFQQRRMDLLRLRSILREQRQDAPGALADLQEAVALADGLLAASPDTVLLHSRGVEMRRRLAEALLAAGRCAEALPLLRQALAEHTRIEASVSGHEQWVWRQRGLLWLLVRACGLAGDVDGALQAVDQDVGLAPSPQDWRGRQELISALADVLATAPAQLPRRSELRTRAEALLAEAFGYGEYHQRNGESTAMVDVMAANTHRIAARLHAATGDRPARLRALQGVADGLVSSYRSVKSERNRARLQRAFDAWLAELLQDGDGAVVAAAVGRMVEAFAGDADAALAAAATAARAVASRGDDDARLLRDAGVAALRAAVAAGCRDATRLRGEEFAALRLHADFDGVVDSAAGR